MESYQSAKTLRSNESDLRLYEVFLCWFVFIGISRAKISRLIKKFTFFSLRNNLLFDTDLGGVPLVHPPTFEKRTVDFLICEIYCAPVRCPHMLRQIHIRTATYCVDIMLTAAPIVS